MNDRVKISAIICTFNRCGSLGKAIESLTAQRIPRSVVWEIVVIDNNSNDGTRQLIKDLQGRYPGLIRYFFEPRQGISMARNAGIQSARGDILAFLDDDEIADPDWLQNLTANLLSSEWAGAGGRVLALDSFTAPPWLESPFLSGPLTSFDQGSHAGELLEPPFGANMAFRREVFDKLGGFRIDLGRSGKSMISNEDTEFGRRVMSAGMRMRYEPSAVAYHPVEASRLCKDYFLTWWFNKGISDFRERGPEPNSFRFCGVPFRLLRALAWQTVLWMTSLNSARRFGRKLQVWVIAGQIFESYQQTTVKRLRPEHDVRA